MQDAHQLIIRSFSPDQDIPHLLALYSAIEANDQTGREVTEQSLRDQLTSSGHDPLKDRWVVDDPADSSQLIGSALLKIAPGVDAVEANILVHPLWRRQGIGGALLGHIIERAHQVGAKSMQIFANSSHPFALSFLQSHKFKVLGAHTGLRLDEGIRLPPVIWPYGYTMRPYSDVQDLAILTEAMNLSYIPLWGHHEVTLEQMSAWLPEMNPESIFLVFSEKGRVVGISRAEPSPERTQVNGVPTGYIDAPGVVPQHRRLDLFRALVLTSINWLHDHGCAQIEMESWGDKLEVLKMYRELGFKDIRQLVCYELKLADHDVVG